MSNQIIIGSRGSDLALWQASYLQLQLQQLGYPSTIEIIQTKGDRIQDLSFDKIEGKGFFTKEIEAALAAGHIDVAVHSLKDMPTEHQEGLEITALSYREDPSDLLIINPDSFENTQVLKLPKGAVVGTSSARRKAQLLRFRPDLNFKDIRGNVPTRLKKLQTESLDAIVLAQAGINRLKVDLGTAQYLKLHPREFAPAPGQGVLAFQCRTEDNKMKEILAQLHNVMVAHCTNVERKVLQLLGGGCHAPLGVYCECDVNGYFHTWAQYATEWNTPMVETRVSLSTYVDMAEQVYDQLQNPA